MDMRIETSDSTRAKFADKLGFEQASPLDLIDRSNYTDDDGYIDAVVKLEMERNSPEYQAARRRLKAQYNERKEAERQKAAKGAYNEIRAGVQLNSVEKKDIDTKAVDLARRDLAAGRIFASDLGAAIERHAKQLTEKEKNTKASDQLFNAMLRGKL